MGPTALLPLQRKALKNPTASAGFEPANLGTKGQHATSRPPKPLCGVGCLTIYLLFKDARSFEYKVFYYVFASLLLGSHKHYSLAYKIMDKNPPPPVLTHVTT